MVNKSLEDEILAKVLWLYYMDGLTQGEIAIQLQLSRQKVGRLIQKAQDEGLVKIQFSPDLLMAHTSLERKFEQHFKLKETIISDSSENPSQPFEYMGKLAAEYLDRILGNGFVLGVGQSTTFQAIIPYVRPRQNTKGTIITIAGGYTQPKFETHLYNIAWRLAELLSVRIEQLYCPMICETAESRNAFLKDPHISEQINQARKCPVALVGIGPVSDNMPLMKMEFLKKDEIDYLREIGAIGEIMGSFFDLNGTPLKTRIDNRVIGLSIEDLCAIPNVVAMAAGLEKVTAIKAALHTGAINTLITDYTTAQAIWELERSVIGELR